MAFFSAVLEYSDQESAIQLLIFLLPPCNSDTLQRLLCLLSTVAAHAEDSLDNEGRKVKKLDIPRFYGSVGSTPAFVWPVTRWTQDKVSIFYSKLTLWQCIGIKRMRTGAVGSMSHILTCGFNQQVKKIYGKEKTNYHRMILNSVNKLFTTLMG